MVLDEVLNHLDGPGRARVGWVLRAMCQRPVARADGGKGEGGEEYGGISTAIVILQDLAAGELEVGGRACVQASKQAREGGREGAEDDTW